MRVVDFEPLHARQDVVYAVALGERDRAVGLGGERAGRHGGLQEIAVPVARDALVEPVQDTHRVSAPLPRRAVARPRACRGAIGLATKRLHVRV